MCHLSTKPCTEYRQICIIMQTLKIGEFECLPSYMEGAGRVGIFGYRISLFSVFLKFVGDGLQGASGDEDRPVSYGRPCIIHVPPHRHRTMIRPVDPLLYWSGLHPVYHVPYSHVSPAIIHYMYHSSYTPCTHPAKPHHTSHLIGLISMVIVWSYAYTPHATTPHHESPYTSWSHVLATLLDMYLLATCLLTQCITTTM